MRKLGRGAAWSAVGVLAAGTVTGAVLSHVGAAAAANSGTAAQQRATPAPPPSGRWFGPGGGPGPVGIPGGPGMFFGGPGQGLGTPLYGEVTVNQNGTDHTYRMQIGSLSAVGGSGFTVTSSDHTKYSYTTDDSTRIIKDGSTATLTGLNGDTVRVLAEETGGRFVARSVVSGQPPHVAVRIAMGTLQVAADGKSVTVGGQTFAVDSSTRVIKNGQQARLGQLKGARVRVIGVRDSAGNLVARMIVEGGPGKGVRPGPPWRWPVGNAPEPGSPASA